MDRPSCARFWAQGVFVVVGVAMNFVVLSLPFALVIVATICDMRRREVPDSISVVMFAWAVLVAAMGWTAGGWLGLVSGFLLGLVLTAGLFYLGGLGGGDVKLIAALGAVLGPWGLLVVLFWMAMAGAMLAVIAVARGQRDFAYVPAIAAGLLVYSTLLSGVWTS